MGDSASRIRRRQEEAERQKAARGDGHEKRAREAKLQEENQRKQEEAAKLKNSLVDFTALPNGMPLAEGASREGKGKTVKPSATEDAHIRRYLADHAELSFKDVSIAVFRLLVQEAADATAIMESSKPGAPEPRRPLYEAISEEVLQLRDERVILKNAVPSGG
ncbi:hypothetical protein ACFQ6C_26530 [Streptomyces sp. NPDC056454]|uniref:hypothetical protein n=1 Tax=Streptomyces sp. NPDC056454 TaxID=3345823 RepID=UPI003695DD3D